MYCRIYLLTEKEICLDRAVYAVGEIKRTTISAKETNVMDQAAEEQGVQQNSVRQKNVDEIFCSSCGALIKKLAEVCPQCGVKQGGRLSKTALLLITFFLGGIGGHKFYTQKYMQGVFYILFCWTGIPGLIAIVEFIIYACTSSEDLEKKYSASGAGVIVGVVAGVVGLFFVGGILAAIAIPQFVAYKNKALEGGLKRELQSVLSAEILYYGDNQTYTDNLHALDYSPTQQGVTIEILSADADCFEAVGRSSDAGIKPMLVDCNGLK